MNWLPFWVLGTTEILQTTPLHFQSSYNSVVVDA